ncbi:MAG: DNA processing protein [Candidatus Peregrinibacteria bacterium Gr01-1014_25]|nr:MAG: DNA processing protein [Candidatus Peregrinibacteria bacterium Gr01-1014_25]
MLDADALFWLSLRVLNRERHEALMEVFGSLKEARRHIGEEMLRGMGCRQDTIERALVIAEGFNAALLIRRCATVGMQMLTIHDDAYPEQLRRIPDPPVFLCFIGDIHLLRQPCIALVGTRSMSPYGKRVTQTFVPRLVAAGAVTVSGLALGIDGEVARETLCSGGKTVAVLGNGLLDIFPPSHRPLSRDIVKGGGLLLSELPPDASPDTYTFPARNRIIAGVSAGTVVLEAPAGSGALQTAEFALEDGRDVFVVPGQIFDENYAGSHGVLAKGQARLVTAPDDVLTELRIVTPASHPATAAAPADPDQAAIWHTLTTMPQRFDDVVAASNVPAPRANAALTLMELAGAARNVGEGQWVRR